MVQGFNSTSEFALLLGKDNMFPKHLQVFYFNQKDILDSEQCKIILAERKTSSLLYKSSKRLGDVADVVTSFYTGDNFRFIRSAYKDVKGAKNYAVVEQDKVFSCTSLYGIPNVQEGYVPYIKSASRRRYVRQNDEWFVRWDKKLLSFIIVIRNQDFKIRRFTLKRVSAFLW